MAKAKTNLGFSRFVSNLFKLILIWSFFACIQFSSLNRQFSNLFPCQHPENALPKRTYNFFYIFLILYGFFLLFYYTFFTIVLYICWMVWLYWFRGAWRWGDGSDGVRGWPRHRRPSWPVLPRRHPRNGRVQCSLLGQWHAEIPILRVRVAVPVSVIWKYRAQVMRVQYNGIAWFVANTAWVSVQIEMMGTFLLHAIRHGEREGPRTGSQVKHLHQAR